MYVSPNVSDHRHPQQNQCSSIRHITTKQSQPVLLPTEKGLMNYRRYRKLRRLDTLHQVKATSNPTTKKLITSQLANNLVHLDNPETDADDNNGKEEEDVDDLSTMNMDWNRNGPIISKNQKYSDKWPLPTHKKHHKRIDKNRLSIDQWKLLKIVPNYSELPNHLFKHSLSNVIPRYRYKIKQWLQNKGILSFVRQRAELMCTLSQLKIEEDYWKNMVSLGMSTVIWLSQIHKNFTRQYSINWDHPRTEHNIKHRQQIIENKLCQAENNLNVHLQRHPLCWQLKNKTFIHHSMEILSKALDAFVYNGLQPLRTNFEQKKILLKFDINDVCLTKSFCNLNPTVKQIRLVQTIWRAKMKSCKRTVHLVKSLTSDSDKLHDNPEQQQSQLYSTESFVPSMCNIIEDRLANIEQRAQQIIQFINAQL